MCTHRPDQGRLVRAAAGVDEPVAMLLGQDIVVECQVEPEGLGRLVLLVGGVGHHGLCVQRIHIRKRKKIEACGCKSTCLNSNGFHTRADHLYIALLP